ncbi:MAG: tetratricopeptide repeat protein [Chitinophagales bacterium]|nr:tetratricopeptide repeat protein [Chitinophagales bacterium]
MKIKELLKNIKDNIGENQLALATSKLKLLFERSNILYEIILHESRYNALNQQIRNGTISFKDSRVEENKIILSLLNIIQDVDAAIKENESIENELNELDLSVIMDLKASSVYKIHSDATYFSKSNFITDIKSSGIPKEITTIPRIDYNKIIGRTKEISYLKSITVKKNIVSIQGIGGIGKTWILKAFADKYYDTFDHLLWIDCASNNIQQKSYEIKKSEFFDSFISNYTLLTNLGIEFPEETSIESKFLHIINSLKKINGKNLLLLDNSNEILDQYYQHILSENWSIIATSRYKFENINTIHIGPLSYSSCNKIYTTITGRRIKMKEFKLINVLKSIDRHTLTIDIMSKVARVLEISLDEVFELIKHNDSELPIIFSDYEKTMFSVPYEILIKCFNMISMNPFEQHVVKALSLLPSIRISIGHLFELIKSDTISSERSLFIVIKSLEKYGWLDYSEGGVLIHQVIQDVVKANTISKNITILDQIISNLAQLLKSSYHNTENRLMKTEYSGYALFIENTYDLKSDSFGIMLKNLAVIIEDGGDYDLSIKLAEKALDIFNSQNLIDEKEVVETTSDIAWTYMLKGDYKLAISLYLKSIYLVENSSNVIEELTLATIHNGLGWTYRVNKELEKAKIELEKALSLRLYKLGRFNPATAQTMGNLSVVLTDLGEYEQAIKTGVEALKIKEKVLGTLHLDVSASYNNVAYTLNLAGNFEQALSYIIKCDDIENKLIDEVHPFTAQRYLNWGKILCNLNKTIEAKEILLKAKDIALKVNDSILHPQVVEIEEWLQKV